MGHLMVLMTRKKALGNIFVSILVVLVLPTIYHLFEIPYLGIATSLYLSSRSVSIEYAGLVLE